MVEMKSVGEVRSSFGERGGVGEGELVDEGGREGFGNTFG